MTDNPYNWLTADTDERIFIYISVDSGRFLYLQGSDSSMVREKAEYSETKSKDHYKKVITNFKIQPRHTDKVYGTCSTFCYM